MPSNATFDAARYARQTILPEIGEDGQARLAQSRVLLVGVGGLGSPTALYLVAAGVGTLGLIDPDIVDASNLQRQVLFGDADIGQRKLEAATQSLRAIAPDLNIELHEGRFEAANARQLVRQYDIVVDGTDNFPARYAVNDACVLEGKPNVHAAVQQFEGQITVLSTAKGPCYRCLFPEPPPLGSVPSCAEAGVLGVLPGTLGLLQATETIKLLLGIGEALIGRLLRWNALDASFREVRIEADPDCPICGNNPTVTDVSDESELCPTQRPDSESEFQVEVPEFDISVDELNKRLGSTDAPTIIDVRLPEEIEIASLEATALCIPLHLLPLKLEELDSEIEYAVLCHHGNRSWQATQFLRARGIARARNIEGGIDVWSQTIDTQIPRY